MASVVHVNQSYQLNVVQFNIENTCTSDNETIVDIGTGNLKGSQKFGGRADHTYDLPIEVQVIDVYLCKQTVNSNGFNIGVGGGDVTLKWDKAANQAHVHAWVNGNSGQPNEVKWTAYAKIRL